ncbi:MAG: hypothetical protein K6T74_03010 [Geminicoccaceae bacterium]|nr:hypothetical protein [Geminicoccaceae bacterium]
MAERRGGRIGGAWAVALGLLAAVALAAEAAAQRSTDPAALCAAFSIPPELGLVCEPAGGETVGVVIRPAEGGFGTLSRLTLRRLDRAAPADALAWSDPAAWLERQMTLDTAGFAAALRRLVDDPDSPLAGETVRAAVETLLGAVDRLGKLALAACENPQLRPDGRHVMSCRFTAGGFGLLLELQLLGGGDERWALALRTMNEQRLRHFRALAGAFRP